MENNIGVLIADDHLLVRQGFKNLLEMQEGIEVIGEAINGIEAVDKTLKTKPDVLLLDINMPKMNGIEALIAIKKKNPNQKIIILTIHNSKEYIQETINHGANGYISKNADIMILKDAIERVYQDEIYIQPTIIESLIMSKNENKTKKHNKPKKLELNKILTPREIDILKEITNGKTNKQIGLTLNISEKTVRNHLYSIFKKLDVSDRTQAALLAFEYNLENNN